MENLGRHKILDTLKPMMEFFAAKWVSSVYEMSEFVDVAVVPSWIIHVSQATKSASLNLPDVAVA